jgi:hypothetical protein
MELKDFFGTYPTINTPIDEFNNKIINKTEFSNLKLQPFEEKPVYGGYYNAQKIIRNFMNGSSPYNDLFLYHKMGSGKTCTAIAVAERLLQLKKIKRVIVLSRGERLLYNFQMEMILNCTGGKYIPEGIDSDDINFFRNARRIYKQYYSFNTYYKFASKLSSTNLSEYENCLFILDEVHNMSDKDDDDDVQEEGVVTGIKELLDKSIDVYSEIHNLIVKRLRNRMCLLLTGTPMTNDANEISAIINLMNPESDQMVVKREWDRRYLDSKKIFNPALNDEFARYITGKISYLDNMIDPNITITHVGATIPTLTKFKVVECPMSLHQSTVYMNAYTQEQSIRLSMKTRQYSNIGIKTENIKDALKDIKNSPDIMGTLLKYSTKFHTIIKTLLANPTKNTFIFSTFVKKHGIESLAYILELFGYSQVNLGNKNKKSLKYAIITSESQSIYAKTVMDIFNTYENRNGEYIQLIIGSESISEGFSLKNVQHIHILNPHWNYAKIDQAIFRGIRLNSHDDLGIGIDVEVFKYVAVVDEESIPENENPYITSIDVRMYKICEVKDLSIQSVERQLLVNAVDCELFKDRNQKPSTRDDSRECQYTSCAYTCTGCNGPNVPDQSTLNIYNFDDYKDPIINVIKKRLVTNNFVDIRELNFPKFQVVAVIDSILNTKMLNRYGMWSALKLDGDIIELVTNIINPEQYYTSNIIIARQKTLQDVIENKAMTSTLIEEFYDSTNDQDRKNIIDTLPVSSQAEIVEKGILEPETTLGKFVNSYYSSYIYITEDGLYFHTVKIDKDPVRILVNGKWKNAKLQDSEEFKQIVINVFYDRYKNITGVYGIQPHDRTKPLRLRDLEMMKVNSQNKGLAVTSCKKDYLHNLLKIIGVTDVMTIKKAGLVISKWLQDNDLIFYELF